MEVFCEAAVLLGGSLVDLQLTLVWGRQQESLEERKPSDLTCYPSVTYPYVLKDMPCLSLGALC